MIYIRDVYSLKDILCRYMYTRQLSALCLGIFMCYFLKIKMNYLKLLGLQISMKLLENLSFVYILFIGDFLWFPPQI